MVISTVAAVGRPVRVYSLCEGAGDFHRSGVRAEDFLEDAVAGGAAGVVPIREDHAGAAGGEDEVLGGSGAVHAGADALQGSCRATAKDQGWEWAAVEPDFNR